MAKTDKELTVEIVNNFIASWNSKPGASPLHVDEVSELIESVYNTISNLPENN